MGPDRLTEVLPYGGRLPLSRRRLLQGAAGIAGGAVIAAATPPRAWATTSAAPVNINDALTIRPRAAWGADLPPTGALEPEQPGDVRFLLVHHTASGNDYAPDAVPDALRGFYRFHTGPEREFPDIAYNFLVDRYGGVWEGRTGSLAAPVKPSATGGSQGYAMLGCYIGDFTADVPPAEARASMLALLAWLADVYDVDTAPEARVTFTSRGSSRWAEGAEVTTPTIAGHRDMSATACPGDAAYADLRATYAVDVTALRAPVVTAPPTASAPATTIPATTVATSEAPTGTAVPTGSATQATSRPATAAGGADAADDSNVDGWVIAGAGAAAAAAVAGAVAYERVGRSAGGRGRAGQHGRDPDGAAEQER